ncbi:MAG: hypothetical protein WDA16_01545 [Candidatus Thermoplasmatota archaeon]
MAFETTLTVPTAHVPEIMGRLSRAGFLVLDTGERVSTEESLEGEALLRLAHVTIADVNPDGPIELGVSA